MKKVAIVGVEGSGKTVMLAGLGELYSHPDNEGFFLAPKNFVTAAYVADKIARMRSGQWPIATAEDVLQGLDWTLRQKSGSSRRPEDICEVSCLDFAGEVYRTAFGITSKSPDEEVTKEVAALKSCIRNATDIIILINLRDVINKGLSEKRVLESMWITNEILSYTMDTSDGRKEPRATIVLSQADSYADTIDACGGAKGVLVRYLPHVANNYGWLDVLAVSAVDKTLMDDDGNIVPAPDFQPSGLKMIMDWILAKGEEKKDGGRKEEKADELTPGDERTIILPGGAKMTFCWCPPGEFMMGSNNGGDNEKPVHRVKLTKGFWMGKTQVTQRQWKSVMGNNPSEFQGWFFKGWFKVDDRPVECVSWDDCQEFIKKVKSQTGLDISLPTEAQWEYACRAGTTGDYAGNLDDMAWYDGNSGDETHPVGTKKANNWGLHDMHGNVWEWCQDWYGNYNGDATNPTGPSSGAIRVNRGGSWFSVARYCRSADRYGNEPGYRSNSLGFRVALAPSSN